MMNSKLNKSYLSALKSCEGLIEPFFSFDDWKGFTSNSKPRKAHRYLVKCLCCGNLYEATFTNGKVSHCPFCHYGTSTDKLYNKYVQSLIEHNFTPLFDRSEFQGSKTPNVKYKSMCTTCGNIYEFQSKPITGYCSCHKSLKVLSKSWNHFQEKCSQQMVTPTITFQDWKGGSISNNYKVSCNICGTVYTTTFQSKRIKLCPKCKRTLYRSNRERALFKFLCDHNIVVFPSYKIPKTLYEIDIFLPEHSVGIELNGLKYHAYNSNYVSMTNITYKPENYHYLKTKLCYENDIKLYHMWEYESFSSICSQVLKILNGEILSTSQVDKNPDLVTEQIKLQHLWIMNNEILTECPAEFSSSVNNVIEIVPSGYTI